MVEPRHLVKNTFPHCKGCGKREVAMGASSRAPTQDYSPFSFCQLCLNYAGFQSERGASKVSGDQGLKLES